MAEFRVSKRERGAPEFDLWVIEGPGSPMVDWGVYFNEAAAEGAAGRLKRAYDWGRADGQAEMAEVAREAAERVRGE